MTAPIIEVDPITPNAATIDRAAALIHAGGCVAFPTETVYGLGANALDERAVARIFTAMERPGFNPLIVHAANVAAARALVVGWPAAADAAAAAFWPGPLTLVLPKHDAIPGIVTAGLGTVGIRVPSHPVALALLQAAGTPIAAPSANRFTRVSPTTAAHVARDLGDRVDLILDGGATPVGIESTVVDLSVRPALLLRPGIIGLDELREVLGEVELAEVRESGVVARPSPGRVERHYSPRAELRLYETDAEAERVAAAAHIAGRRVGALPIRVLAAPADHVIAMPDDAVGYARLLYAAIHSLDDNGCDLILVERPPAQEAWRGIIDRLERAAE